MQGNQYTGKLVRVIEKPSPMTLIEAGIDKNLAHTARRLARLSSEAFEEGGHAPRYFGGSFSGAIERHIPAPHCAIGLVALRTKVASILPLSSGIEATP
jgi:hypothetical protein